MGRCLLRFDALAVVAREFQDDHDGADADDGASLLLASFGLFCPSSLCGD